MKEKYYLAYGSNLNIKELLERCPSAEIVGVTVLRGYSLAFKGNADNYSYLTIEPQETGVVPVGIFMISSEDEESLDRYEGYPSLYGKQYFTIELNGQKVEALIYVMNSEFSYHLPSHEYFVSCLRGYCDFHFDLHILRNAFSNTEVNLERKRQKNNTFDN